MMHFVPLTSAEQQECWYCMERAACSSVSKRVMASVLRAQVAEFGIMEKLGSPELER